MALQYRKLVRDAVLAELSANFNLTLAGLAATYGITPFTIDFTGASYNFAVAHIDEAYIERYAGLLTFPSACLYTTDVATRGHFLHGFSFSGEVICNIDFYVRSRDGAEGLNEENYFDAIEDAVITILESNSIQWPSGVTYTRDIAATRQYLIPLGDGFATQIPIAAKFEVNIL